MKNRYLSILFLFISVGLYSQNKVDMHNFDKQLDFSIQLIEEQDFKSAYNNLIEIYQLDSSNAKLNYYIAYASFFTNRDKGIALPYLLKGISFNKNAYFLMGKVYQGQEKLRLAREAYNNYKSANLDERLFELSEVNREIEKLETAQLYIANSTNILVKNLGNGINSTYPDYAPVIFSNGNKLYFTSRKEGSFSEFRDPNNEYFEDVYLCEKINDRWQEPVNIGMPINTKTHDALLSVSSNADTIYIYRTNPNLVGGDILFSYQLPKGKWSEPVPFESTINTKQSSESSICIHPDGNQIFFSSNREGGYGGKDIYSVIKLPNGEWSLPSNLGGMINTEADEDGPFISPDGVHLYFSSKAHENMGGYDLFVSQLNPNGQWKEPRNLGYPVNSVNDDIFISTLNDEDYFFSSNRSGGHGFTDIYYTSLPKKKKEHLIIKGRVINNNTQESLRATITLFDRESNNLTGVYKSDKKSGKFVMILNPGDAYKMFVESDGYYNQTLQIDLDKALSLEDVLKTIRLTKKLQENKDIKESE